MNDKMITLVAVAATVLYEKNGVIDALVYMEEHGWSRQEAIDLLAYIDNLKGMVEKGQLR